VTTKERLTRLTEHEGDFVRLSRGDVEDTLRLFQTLGRALAANLPSSIDRSRFVRIAQAILDQRQERSRQLPAELFGEAGWTILLELYARGALSEEELSSVADASGTPESAARRWTGFLEEQDLVCWKTDAGLEAVHLTSKARRILDSYFCQVLTAWHR